MKNAINWFEIPVTDFDRAKSFYATIFDGEITEMPMPNAKYGVLPYDQASEGVGGAIIQADGLQPSQGGSNLYLNGGEDLSVVLSRVETAGGKVVLPKTNIGDNGFMASFIDSEGNRLSLHSFN